MTRQVVLARPTLEAGFDAGFTAIGRPKKSVGGCDEVSPKHRPLTGLQLTLSAMSIFLPTFCLLFPERPSSVGSSRSLSVRM